MGIHFGPLVANAFMAYLEQSLKRDCSIRDDVDWPVLYGRYIDDGFFIYPISTNSPDTCPRLSRFKSLLMTLDPKLRLTFNTSTTSVDFLDLTITLVTDTDMCTVATRTYAKSLSRFLYVPYSSCHNRSNLSCEWRGESRPGEI